MKVQLYVYDLTRGLAAQLSPMLLGQQVMHAHVLIRRMCTSPSSMLVYACASHRVRMHHAAYRAHSSTCWPQVEGVWHTGLVVHGQEYFFGYGIQKTRAGCTPFGPPYRVIDLG
jgi:hypothetical protein